MEFLNFLKAGYPLLWVETHEENRAIKTFVKESEGYNCFSFDVVSGLYNYSDKQVKNLDSPVEFLDNIKQLPEKTVIFAKDFHKFIDDLEVYRTIKNLMAELKSYNKHIIFVSPVTAIPIELQKDIVTIDFNLPTIKDLMGLAEKIVSDNGIDLEVNQIDIDAARGLTMEEAENSFARSLITTKKYDRKLLESDKLQIVKKSGLMEIYTPEPIENIGGLQRLKDYILSRKIGFDSNNNLPTPKGICLTGGPGSGKSLSAKAIASVLEMPLIKLDLGTLKGSLVGESEKNMKQATDMIDAISPCVVWMDEIEKSLSGSASSGKTDGGSSSNMLAQLLTWMQESKAQHYIVATCNDINVLMEISQGAIIRRFDNIFFVDLPSKNERKQIFDIMLKRYNVELSANELENYIEKSNQFTGAEIEKFIKNSLYDGLEIAFDDIKPINVQNAKLLEKAREWAKNNAIIANETDEQKETRSLNI